MLKYSEIKKILYNSTEIQQIPDKWEESVPLFCTINEENVVAYIYWTVSHCLKIKQMIGINRESGKVLQLNDEELIKEYGISSNGIKPVTIIDYDKYFSDKERYEEMFSKFCDCENIDIKYKQETLELIKSIVGMDLFENVILLIAKEYINTLSQE